jgi:hypothetical protein
VWTCLNFLSKFSDKAQVHSFVAQRALHMRLVLENARCYTVKTKLVSCLFIGRSNTLLQQSHGISQLTRARPAANATTCVHETTTFLRDVQKHVSRVSLFQNSDFIAIGLCQCHHHYFSFKVRRLSTKRYGPLHPRPKDRMPR